MHHRRTAGQPPPLRVLFPCVLSANPPPPQFLAESPFLRCVLRAQAGCPHTSLHQCKRIKSSTAHIAFIPTDSFMPLAVKWVSELDPKPLLSNGYQMGGCRHEAWLHGHYPHQNIKECTHHVSRLTGTATPAGLERLPPAYTKRLHGLSFLPTGNQLVLCRHHSTRLRASRTHTLPCLQKTKNGRGCDFDLDLGDPCQTLSVCGLPYSSGICGSTSCAQAW